MSFLANFYSCRTTNVMPIVDCGGLKPNIFLRQDAFPLAVLTGAARDDFEGYVASVRGGGDSLDSSHTPPVLLVLHLDHGVLPLLHHAPSSPQSNVRVFFIGQDFRVDRPAAIRLPRS